MKKIISLFLVIILLMTTFTFTASAAAKRENPKRAIAIVFDNSGSMYLPSDAKGDPNPQEQAYAWCRATYAMEAFATMMNDSDVMQIYPMHAIEVNGQQYSASNPLTITQKTASTIRSIYTPDPKATPIETISTARDGLVSLNADEKWLIVLTDGDTFYKGGKNLTDKTLSELEPTLQSCSEQVNVLYLGVGTKAIVPQIKDSKNQYFADKAESSTQVLEKLSAMCNMVFGRDTLPNVKDKISFDVSLSKLIVFVQGSGITDVKLGDKTPTVSSDMKYGTKGGGGQATGKFKIDETLQGVMLTYTDLDAGEYALSYGGTASSVVCYYEPDVDLVAEVLDAEGNAVNKDSELTAGTYTLAYHMVDKNGEPVNSTLLGKTKYKVTYSINGNEETVTADKAGSIELEMQPNDQIDVNFEVTYLDGYTITRTSADLGWPTGGLKFLPPPAGMLKAELSGGQSKYSLTDLPNGEKFRVTFIYNDAVCTSDQLDNVKVNAKVNNGKVGCVIDRDDEGYYVVLDYHETPLKTDCGNFELQVTGVYTNEDNLQTNMAVAKADFSIEDNSRTLEMSVDQDQSYYQISKIKDAKPIIIKLSFSGDPLTEEEMKKIKLSVESDIDVRLEPDYKNSCYKAYFDADNPPESDSYTLRFIATGTNEIGKKMAAEEEIESSFGVLPMWLRILLPILILLLIALLIWLYMRQPVLPKRIELSGVEYHVDGEPIPSKVPLRYTGAGKKKGDLRAFSPRCTTDSMAEQGITLELEAVSPRYVKSRQRKALVKVFRPKNAQHVLSLKIKSNNFIQDPEHPNKFVLATTGKPMAKPIELSNNSIVEIVSDTGTSSAFYHCKFVFK